MPDHFFSFLIAISKETKLIMAWAAPSPNFLIRDGQSKSLLKICTREPLGHDLRRIVRDVVCEDNSDASAVPRHHLDSEIFNQVLIAQGTLLQPSSDHG